MIQKKIDVPDIGSCDPAADTIPRVCYQRTQTATGVVSLPGWTHPPCGRPMLREISRHGGVVA